MSESAVRYLICDQCETVEHCTKNGCVPKVYPQCFADACNQGRAECPSPEICISQHEPLYEPLTIPHWVLFIALVLSAVGVLSVPPWVVYLWR